MPTAEHTPHRAPPIDASTELALARTRAAYERTMMAWIRAATSPITFGFSVYKFFQLEAPGRKLNNRLIGPRQFALVLVSRGQMSLLLATLEHRRNIRVLGVQCSENRHLLAALLAALACFGALGTMLYQSDRNPHRHELALVGSLTILPFVYQVCSEPSRAKANV